jgi:hypothetical protein
LLVVCPVCAFSSRPALVDCAYCARIVAAPELTLNRREQQQQQRRPRRTMRCGNERRAAHSRAAQPDGLDVVELDQHASLAAALGAEYVPCAPSQVAVTQRLDQYRWRIAGTEPLDSRCRRCEMRVAQVPTRCTENEAASAFAQATCSAHWRHVLLPAVEASELCGVRCPPDAHHPHASRTKTGKLHRGARCEACVCTSAPQFRQWCFRTLSENEICQAAASIPDFSIRTRSIRFRAHYYPHSSCQVTR